jgi:hypothetical protein
MKSHSAIFAALVLTLTASPSHSEVVGGYGLSTCEQWANWHRGQPTSETAAAENWAVGYLEGLADMAEGDRLVRRLPAMDVMRGLDRPTIVALVSEYCRPQRLLKNAVHELGGTLVGESLVVSSGVTPQATRGARVLQVKTAVPETTGAAVVETTGSIAATRQRGACETLLVQGRTPSGAAVTRTLSKCN